MKTYTVIVGRTEFSRRTIEANSPEQAEELAYQTPPEKWSFCYYGDFEHYQTNEGESCELN